VSTDDQVAPAPADAAAAERPSPDFQDLSRPYDVDEDLGTVMPPVVAVMVAHDPGPWFEESLAALGGQTYAAMSVLVIGTGADLGSGELERRIAAVLPSAHLRTLEGNPGFGAAANECLRAVAGAPFLLFLHDDVALASDAVQHLVEEAYRSNASVLGPKLVDWDSPDLLREVGWAVDKAGAPAALVEAGELDQEQHDAVRDVAAVSNAAMLIRTDVFEAVGGFDEAITYFGDDIDLCWRSAAAGARVLIVPDAVARHRGSLTDRRPDLRPRRLALRHQLRAVLANYGVATRLRIVPQMLLLAVTEVLYAILLGRFGHAADVVGAWSWNRANRDTLRARQSLLAGVREVSDREIRRMHVRGSARVSAWVRDRIGGEDGLPAMVLGATNRPGSVAPSGTPRLVIAVWAVVLGGLVLSTRSLWTSGVPTAGTLVPFPASVTEGAQAWLSGFRSAGVGSVGPAPIGLLLSTILSALFLGSGAFARSALLLALLPIGALGAWRMARPIGSRRARLAALLVYAAAPLAANAFAGARFGGLALYAAMPWILGHLARASGIAPFGTRDGPAGPGVVARPVAFRCVSLGAVVALVGIVVPSAVGIVLIVAVLWAVGGLLVGQVRGALALIGTSIGATLVAIVLLLPSGISIFSWSSATMTSPLLSPTSSGGRSLSLAEVLRFETGPFGATPFGWAILPAAALALLIGRSWRLSWASRGWMLSLAGWAGVLASANNVLPVYLPEPEVLLAPALAGLALAAAMGVAAFEVDLPGYQIGWRQWASVVCAASLFVALLPVLATAVDGRFGLTEGDYQRAVANLSETADGPFRVLWVGDASVLPLAGQAADVRGITTEGDGRALAFAATEGGAVSMENLWALPSDAGLAQITNVLAAGGEGGSRMGALLAPLGIRFVVVVERLAPGRFANERMVDQPRLNEVLGSQLDMARVSLSGAAIYRNAAWGSPRGVLSATTAFPETAVAPAERVVPGLSGQPPAMSNGRSLIPAAGSVPDSVSLYLATPIDEGITMNVDGRRAPGRSVMGWASVYDIGQGGQGVLAVRNRPLTVALQFGQAALWILVAVYLLRSSSDGERRRRRARSAS